MLQKDKIKVLFSTDEDGYILGYQKEFWDGIQWQVPFDDSKALLVTPESIESIIIGASKIDSNGNITLDEDKKSVLEKQEQDFKTPEEQVASLRQSNDALQSALLELSDLVLSGGDSK